MKAFNEENFIRTVKNIATITYFLGAIAYGVVYYHNFGETNIIIAVLFGAFVALLSVALFTLSVLISEYIGLLK